MNSQTVVMCVVAFILGMLLAHMLKSVCGCKTVKGRADLWAHLDHSDKNPDAPNLDLHGMAGSKIRFRSRFRRSSQIY